LDASARVKFSIQVAVACGLYAFGFRVETLTTPWGVMALGVFSLPITVLWIVGVTNAVNLIDGLDGLAGGVSLIALAAVFFIGASRGDAFMMLFSAALGGAVLGFLFYNFNPATIFMGDTGSMFLGFMLAVCSIKAGQKSSTAVALFPVALLALPLCDTVVAMWRRLASGLPPFTGDREHFHHRLLARGLSHRNAVTTLYGVATIFATLAIVLYNATGWLLAGSVGGLMLVLHLLLSNLGYYRDLVPRRRTAQAVATVVALTRVQPPLVAATTQRRVLRRRVIPAAADTSLVAVPRRLRRDSYIGE
ncbi:MAG TPA: MraY family glycosyltransferase, partial [Polyangia bacterium]|nr:MraY family glycosyltransferase [Polyangia bacterium]